MVPPSYQPSPLLPLYLSTLESFSLVTCQPPYPPLNPNIFAPRGGWRGRAAEGIEIVKANRMQRNERERETKRVRPLRRKCNGWKCRSRKLISTLLRQKRIGPLYHARNIYRVGSCSQRYPDTKRDSLKNIAVVMVGSGARGGDSGRRSRRAVVATHAPGEHFFSSPLLFHPI